MLQNKFCFFHPQKLCNHYIYIFSKYFFSFNNFRNQSSQNKNSHNSQVDVNFNGYSILLLCKNFKKGVNPCVKIVYKTLLYLIL